jgi:hypothetical protein
VKAKRERLFNRSRGLIVHPARQHGFERALGVAQRMAYAATDQLFIVTQ